MSADSEWLRLVGKKRNPRGLNRLLAKAALTRGTFLAG